MTDAFLTSPLGRIDFIALQSPVKNKFNPEEEAKYIARLEFDGTTTEGKKFKQQIETINNKLVVASQTAGHYFVKSKSKFKVKVLDADNNQIEHESVPRFPKGSTGMARMIVKPFTGSSKGGTVNLIGVQLVDLDIVATKEGASEGNNIVDALRAAIEKSNG